MVKGDFQPLFLVMEFVPLNLAGVYRPLRFINYLAEKGEFPIVVTFEIDETVKKLYPNIDLDLNRLLHKNVTVYRVPLAIMKKESRFQSFLSIYFNLSDGYRKLWKKSLFNTLPGIFERHAIHQIIVTCPPFSGALLAYEISKKYNIDLYLDMRDAWSQLSMNPIGSRIHYFFKRNLERKVFSQAKKITTVTPQLKNAFIKNHPSIDSSKFELIFNGFDFKLPENLVVNFKGLNDSDSIHIGYSGSYYFDPIAYDQSQVKWWKRKGHRKFFYTPVKEDWSYRSPYYFLQSMYSFLKNNPQYKNRLYFHHIGEKYDWLEQMILNFDLRENCILHGYLTRSETKELQDSFDLLLATSELVEGAEHYCLPSKLFTYIQSQKPILGFVTDGIQKEFILKSNIGRVINPRALDTLEDDFKNVIMEGFSNKIDLVYLSNFDNERLSAEFRNVIEKN
jgi:hypothetical protein